jgi:septal ring factor EnvC (AmiA/AmiB activator)
MNPLSMDSRLYSLIAVLCVGGAAALVPSCLWARQRDDAAEVEMKIEREHNPIKKARLEIRLARLDLRHSTDAYNHNQVQEAEKLLSEYLDEINSSWRLLESTGRNPARQPQGFMQLEIALRENARTLKDLQDRVDYMYQDAVEKAENEVNQLHSKVVLALFPGAAPPPAVNKASKAPSSLAGKELHP